MLVRFKKDFSRYVKGKVYDVDNLLARIVIEEDVAEKYEHDKQKIKNKQKHIKKRRR